MQKQYILNPPLTPTDILWFIDLQGFAASKNEGGDRLACSPSDGVETGEGVEDEGEEGDDDDDEEDDDESDVAVVRPVSVTVAVAVLGPVDVGR